MRTIITAAFLSVFLVTCIACAQENEVGQATVAKREIDPRLKITWRFPISKLKKIELTNSNEQSLHCKSLKEAIKQTKRHKFSKDAFSGNEFITSVEGDFYHIKYRNENFTVYRDVKLYFDQARFPTDPYRADAGSERDLPFTVIPGLEHKTPSAFQNIVFGNPLSEIFYQDDPNLRKLDRQPNKISPENAELLSLIFNSMHGFFGGNAKVMEDFEPFLGRFRAALGMGFEIENWLIRYKVDGSVVDLRPFEGWPIDLASNDEYLYIYQKNVKNIYSYIFGSGIFYYVNC